MFVNKKIIEKLKKLALKAKNLKEVPISCVIAKNDKIISSAYNTCLSTGNPLNHAEMLAIKKALIKTKRKYLNHYDIYSSLEPCSFCASAISLCRIKRVFFCAYDTKFGVIENGIQLYKGKKCSHKPKVIGGIEEKFFSELLKFFFQNKR